MNEFSLWLQEQLEQRGWSQSYLAKRIKRSRQSISAVVTGRNNPTLELCYLLADAFNESPDTIIGIAGIIGDTDEDMDLTSKSVLSLLSGMNDKSRSDVLKYTRLRHENPID